MSQTLPQTSSLSTLRGARLLMVAHSNSTHTHRWSQYFKNTHGMEVLVISPLPDKINGIDVVQFPAKKSWYHKLKGLHLRIDYLKWSKLVRSFAPDIVHVHYPDGGSRNKFYFNGLPRVITSTWGSEVVESPDFPLSEKHKAGVRAMLAHSHVVTATTKFLGEWTAKYCAPGTPIHIIPFGVDCDRFAPPTAKTQRPIRIGFVKNLERKYGPEQLVEAFPDIARACPDARLIMCGKGDMAEPLKARVAQLGLADRVEFPGRLPHEQVVPLMQSLDVMVMPSTCQESFGVAAIEASACEVPVVASQVGGVPEAVVDGETGMLIQPYDPGAISRACIDLINDPDRRHRMGVAGRKFVLDHYQWNKNAETMASVYAQMLAGASVKTPKMM